MVQPVMWCTSFQQKQSTALQRPCLVLLVNAAVFLFSDLEIPLWYLNICVACLAYSMGVVFNERGEATWHVWKPAGTERNKVLYCSSQPGISRYINFKYFRLFVNFCGDLNGDYNGNLYKFIPALQNKKKTTLKIKFLIKFFIFNWKFNFQRKINIASWVTMGWFHHY